MRLNWILPTTCCWTLSVLITEPEPESELRILIRSYVGKEPVGATSPKLRRRNAGATYKLIRSYVEELPDGATYRPVRSYIEEDKERECVAGAPP